MPMPAAAARQKFPAAPRCRGGASSLIRLSSAHPLGAVADRPAWMHRLALSLSPGLPEPAPASIVTPLRPSADQLLAVR